MEASPDKQWLAVCPGISTCVYIFPGSLDAVEQERPYATFDAALEAATPIRESDRIGHLCWSSDSNIVAVGTTDGNLYTISR